MRDTQIDPIIQVFPDDPVRSGSVQKSCSPESTSFENHIDKTHKDSEIRFKLIVQTLYSVFYTLHEKNQGNTALAQLSRISDRLAAIMGAAALPKAALCKLI